MRPTGSLSAITASPSKSVGGTLTAGAVSDPDEVSALTYQWQYLVGTTWTDYSPAQTALTHSILANDIGKTVRVVVGYEDTFGRHSLTASTVL
jgi:hypothetical protein